MAGPSSRGAKKPRVLSHYRLGQLIGSGAMGAVHQATDRRDRTPVAIKLLHPHLTNDEPFRERFEREAHVGALLRSPYTVHILDYGVEQDQYFIVMEYVDGETLRDAMRSGPLPWKRALRVAVQVARALEEAQARGVVHRDIKPENIMLRVRDSVKVTDFGIARQVGGGTLTMPGVFIGTLAYAAPEQFAGRADHRSDIYSLGATLYDMLAGRPPFTGTIESLITAIRESPPDMRALAGLPRSVTVAIERCLAKDPDQRYQSASLVAAALEEAARTTPTDEPETPMPTAQTMPDRGDQASAVPRVSGTQLTVPTGRAPVSVGLVTGKGLPIVGTRLGAASYEIKIRNHTDRQIELRLSAEDPEGACRFSHATTVAVTPGGTTTTRLKVIPESRRWRGGPQSRSFTVAVSGDEADPPSTVDGRYEDKSYGWLPYGGGAVACLVAVGVFLGMFTLGHGNGAGTAAAITPEQLADLVLSRADLGPEYAGFQEDASQSGTFSNDEAIAASCVPERESDQITSQGRISGYRMTHVVAAPAGAATPIPSETPGPTGSETPSPGAPASQPSPAEPKPPAAFLVSSEVALFQDEEGAVQSISSLTEDPSANVQLLGCGEYVAVGEMVTFQPSGVGDRSIGIEQMAADAGQTASLGTGAGRRQQADRRLTILRFARSTMTGTVTIVDAGGPPQRDKATELAAKLDGRIRALLGAPLASPAPTSSARPSSDTGSATPTPFPASATPQASATVGGVVPSQAPGQTARATQQPPVQFPTLPPNLPPPWQPPPIQGTALPAAAQFTPPGSGDIHGLTWDGEHLWLADQAATIFKVTTTGTLKGSYSAPDTTLEGLTWDGATFWLFSANFSRIYQFVTEGPGQTRVISSCDAPNQRIGGNNDGLAWDGASLWYSDTYNVYRLDTACNILSSFAFPHETTGLAWDGQNLWLAYNTFPGPENATLAKTDTQGNILATFEVALPYVDNLTWGAGYLWVAGSDSILGAQMIYRIDV